MTKRWSSRRKKLAAGAGLATVLVASGVGLAGPLPAWAADTSTTTAGPGAARVDDFYGPPGDAWYVRFRVCPQADATAAPASAALGVAGGSATVVASPAPDLNGDVMVDDPAFVLLPMKPDPVGDNYSPAKRRGLCYDMAERQIVRMNDPATAPTTAPAAPADAAPTTSTAPVTGG